MSKKVLIISSSYRKNGNSETLAKEFERGANESGNKTEMIYLRNYKIDFCRGCLACQQGVECPIQDGIRDIMEKVKNAEVLVFATPIYYYCISGQLKTLLDRLNPLYGKDNKFKEVYLLATATDENPEAMEVAKKEIEGWIECFEGVELKSVLRGTGCTLVGDVRKDKDLLNIAYDMGKEV